MYEYRCSKCGDIKLMPDVLRCPICHKILTDCTDEYIRKHVGRCALMKSPYVYSECKPGRPKTTDRMENLNQRYI